LSFEQEIREHFEGELVHCQAIHHELDEEVEILRLTIIATNQELATFSEAVGFASSKAEPAGQNIPDDIAMTYRKLK